MRAAALGLVLLLGCVSAPSAIWAQTDDASRSAARDLATAGVEAFQKEQFGDASAKLDKAYRVLKVPSIGLWSARALVKVGQLVKASERYREVLRLGLGEGDAAVQKQAQAEAQTELDALTPRIPRIVIKLAGATPDDTTLQVDGTPMSSALVGEMRPVDPGKHMVRGARGAETAEAEVTLNEGETRDAVLHFEGKANAPAPVAVPAPVAAPPPASAPPQAESSSGGSKTLAIVALGVGVVGVGVGTVFGLRAKSKLDDANDAGCSGDTCPNRGALDANDAAANAGTISTVAFIVGGVGLAAGATLWLTAGSPSRKTAALGIGPGSVRLKAVW